MKVYSWEKVIVSWANALQLKEEPIIDISDLFDGSFFIGLLKQLGREIKINHDNKKQIVEKFIEENYSSVTIKNVWDNNELTIISSLLLLTSSLEVSHLRAPLYHLSTNIQLNIQAFIQRCLLFPKNSITREVIVDVIDCIETSEEDDEQETVEPSSFVSSPNTSFTTLYQSPDIRSATKNKVKFLQNQVDVLHLDKLHLQEELEFSKQELTELGIKCNSKEQELLHLKNELFLLRNNCESCDNNLRCNSMQVEELKLLRDDFALLQAALCFTRSELEILLGDNQELKDKFFKEEKIKLNLEKKLEESESKLASMAANVEQLESKHTILKSLCQEQEDLLRERGCAKVSDETVPINDESVLAVGTGESLASIVDLKYAELEEETKMLRERLAQSEATVINLEVLISKQELTNQTKGLTTDSSELINTKTGEEFAGPEVHNQSNDILKEMLNPREFQTVVFKNLHLSQFRCSTNHEKDEIDRLHDMLEAKAIRLEESAALSEKLRRDLDDRERELKTTTASLRQALSECERLRTIQTLNQSEIEDLQLQLEISGNRLVERDDRIAALTADIGERVCETEELKEQIAMYEQNVLTNITDIKNKDTELNEAKSNLETYNTELESMKNDLCAKASLVAELQHDVQMCQHEKVVLEKKMDLVLKDLQKNESKLKKEINRYEQEVIRLKGELEKEKAKLKIVEDQVELEDRLNNAFDLKLTELQAKMKIQYEKELSGAVEEYKDKINQLKLKITKDKLHIQELGADLWNTTDRLLLSQQQCEALRNQLRRTKCALEILSNSTVRRHSLATSAAVHRASNPCLWLQAEDGDSNPIHIFDDPLTTMVKRKGIIWSSINDVNSSPLERRRRFSLVLESSPAHEEQEEIFNDAFLQDLKDGICRLPNESQLYRASCPPVTKLPESPMNVEKISDKQVLIPPEKPKRKGQIAYSRPGPPTPCRTAGARLSLQTFEKTNSTKLKENNNCAPLQSSASGGPSRFSKLFATAKGQNKTKPMSQDSTKMKRKNFFQRKFCSNRENLPPN